MINLVKRRLPTIAERGGERPRRDCQQRRRRTDRHPTGTILQLQSLKPFQQSDLKQAFSFNIILLKVLWFNTGNFLIKAY